MPDFRKQLGAIALALIVAGAGIALGQPYADLRQQSAKLTAAQRTQAQTLFSNAFKLWQAGDYAAAELGFRQGLDIDPSNGGANYYYGDILQRKGQRDLAAEYMARTVALAPTSAEALKAQVTLAGPLKPIRSGDTFRDCPDVCPEMVAIPPGGFLMGDGTQHPVTIPAAFAAGKYTVTFAEWDACVAEGGCGGYRPEDRSYGRGRMPVINVSWDDAQAYAAWLSRKTGRAYRLLSEAEWEYAARAGKTTAYYWGDTVGSGNANCNGCGSQWDNKQSSPVGSFLPNAFGLYDMSGNVYQWTADCYGSYDSAPTDGSARQSGDCTNRVLRGGSWYMNPRGLRSAARMWSLTPNRYSAYGFRVARTL